MKKVDDFLHRHDVDVSRSIALLLFVSAFSDVTTTLGSFLISHVSLQLGFIISIPLGVALWHYSPQARKFCIGLVWFISVLIAVFSLWMLFRSGSGESMHRFHLTFGDSKIIDPTFGQISICVLFYGLFIYLLFSVIYSNKFYLETNKSNKALDSTPES